MVVPPIIPDPETQGRRLSSEPVTLARSLSVMLGSVMLGLLFALLFVARNPSELVFGLLLWILTTTDVARVIKRAWS